MTDSEKGDLVVSFLMAVLVGTHWYGLATGLALYAILDRIGHARC